MLRAPAVLLPHSLVASRSLHHNIPAQPSHQPPTAQSLLRYSCLLLSTLPDCPGSVASFQAVASAWQVPWL